MSAIAERTDTTIAERVAKGAALLDELVPDWWHRIDLTTLALVSPCQCVLGQLFPSPDYALSSYTNGLVALHLETYAGSDFGFDADTAGTDGEGGEYDALTTEWRRVIEERRGVAS
jgi:hypothetical protein